MDGTGRSEDLATLPAMALSVRQPWAWAIVYAGKDIENRSWRRGYPSMSYRGPFCIHAAAGMTRDEYELAAESMSSIGISCPPPAQLMRGGIIGTAHLKDMVRESASPWFFGPVGLVIVDPKPVPFIGVGGELGFFTWWKDGPKPPPAAPAKWMTNYGAVSDQTAPAAVAPGLFGDGNADPA